MIDSQFTWRIYFLTELARELVALIDLSPVFTRNTTSPMTTFSSKPVLSHK